MGAGQVIITSFIRFVFFGVQYVMAGMSKRMYVFKPNRQSTRSLMRFAIVHNHVDLRPKTATNLENIPLTAKRVGGAR